jgi:DNA polymerase elongation subunit (family B)
VSSMVSKNLQRTTEVRDDVMFERVLDKNWQRTIEEKDDVMFDYNIDKSCFLFIESCATISIVDLRILLEILEERQAKEKRPNRRI